MNDPHVEALIYVVEHDKSTDYGQAKSVEIKNPIFYLRLEENEARFELKKHYPNRQEAQEAIEPFIQQWKLKASLESGPKTFSLKFKCAEIIDQDPTPGVISVAANPVTFNFGVSCPTITVYRQYPDPPSGRQMEIGNPDVQTMLHRFLGYREGREPLPSMAYFCCEVFIKRMGNGLKHAADKHEISHKLLKRVSNLASNKGGNQARHQSGIDKPLTHVEEQFLQKAVAAFIIRAAIVAADPNQPMETINSSNLLEISP